jgi:putative FmdB family regulatory protein
MDPAGYWHEPTSAEEVLMPLYDFACDACGHEFEARAEPGGLAPCPACSAVEVRRLWRPIAPPAKIGLRGRAARESDARRAEREARRRGET